MNKNRRDITFIRIQKESLYEPVSLSINGETFYYRKDELFSKLKQDEIVK